MRLLYLANNRIPSEKANSVQVMQCCAAFARRGADVTLAVPHRLQPWAMRGVGDPFDYYGLVTRFPIRYLPCIDLLEVAPGPMQPAAFALQAATFALAAGAYVRARDADRCYTRDPSSAVLLALGSPQARRRAFYEAHTFPKPGPRRRLHLWAARRLGGVVAITRGLANEYVMGGVEKHRVLVAPDAVDPERFTGCPDGSDRAKAREELGIAAHARVVCYTGHLYDWKGAHTLALASRLLPEGFLTYIVGGTEEDLASFRRFLAEERLERVVATGHVPPGRVPAFLAAADVLVLPNSARSETSARFTSPMKLFEYMAAGRPIVASELPSLEEVLRDGENAVLVEPDDPEALAKGVARVGGDAALARRLADAAQRDVRGRTWDARAAAILEFMETNH